MVWHTEGTEHSAVCVRCIICSSNEERTVDDELPDRVEEQPPHDYSRGHIHSAVWELEKDCSVFSMMCAILTARSRRGRQQSDWRHAAGKHSSPTSIRPPIGLNPSALLWSSLAAFSNQAGLAPGSHQSPQNTHNSQRIGSIRNWGKVVGKQASGAAPGTNHIPAGSRNISSWVSICQNSTYMQVFSR